MERITRHFRTVPDIVTGEGALASIGEVGGRLGDRVVLVTGGASARKSGSLERARSMLKDRIVRAANRRIVTASERGEGNEAYAADARTRGKVLYLSGHTHKAELVEWNPGRVYANPGSWTAKGRGCAITVEGRIVRLLEVVA